jgi:hypothetical protein
MFVIVLNVMVCAVKTNRMNEGRNQRANVGEPRFVVLQRFKKSREGWCITGRIWTSYVTRRATVLGANIAGAAESRGLARQCLPSDRTHQLESFERRTYIDLEQKS